MSKTRWLSAVSGAVTVSLMLCGLPAMAAAQPKPAPAVTEPAPPPADALGRGTPRGTVVGFLNASRRGEMLVARQYLDTTAGAEQADLLARQLFEVLDARFPARLTAISDAPDGSRRNPLAPDREVVGVVATAPGSLDIVLERVQRGATAPIWLFSRATLAAIPAVHADMVRSRSATPLQRLVERTPLGNSPLLPWLMVPLALVAFYVITLLLNRLFTPLAARLHRRIVGGPHEWSGGVLPIPARLLLTAVAVRWILANVALSLFVRHFWDNAASITIIASVVWLLILANGEVESYVLARMSRTNMPAAASLVRLLRRGADALVVFVGLFATLRLFAVDATPALAGLGVGGIAIALAAQKTLENVVAGASLIFDQAVRVGDTLKMGEFAGTVDHIGLRSTRIRTLDRTIVSVPNAQIANASLETLSARDKFWFRHVVGLTYDTTPEQLRVALGELRRLMARDRCVDSTSVRVRFFRLGAFSLDVEIVAYIMAADWNQFLELQEDLLFGVMDTIAQSGAEIAFPTQTMRVEPQKQI